MILTEEEKKQILSKYDGNTSNELLTYLKRNFPVSEFKFDWMNKPIKQMMVDDKIYNIEYKKKYLLHSITLTSHTFGKSDLWGNSLKKPK